MADITPETYKDLRKIPLTVYIGSPDHVLYDGQAYSVTTVNEKGPLDVLPAHENFISIIRDKVTLRDMNDKLQEFKIDVGVIHVNENQVEIFSGIREVDIASLTKGKDMSSIFNSLPQK